MIVFNVLVGVHTMSITVYDHVDPTSKDLPEWVQAILKQHPNAKVFVVKSFKPFRKFLDDMTVMEYLNTSPFSWLYISKSEAPKVGEFIVHIPPEE